MRSAREPSVWKPSFSGDAPRVSGRGCSAARPRYSDGNSVSHLVLIQFSDSLSILRLGVRRVKLWTQRKAVREAPYLYSGFWAAMGAFVAKLLALGAHTCCARVFFAIRGEREMTWAWLFAWNACWLILALLYVSLEAKFGGDPLQGVWTVNLSVAK
jgi:hypothetical protein